MWPFCGPCGSIYFLCSVGFWFLEYIFHSSQFSTLFCSIVLWELARAQLEGQLGPRLFHVGRTGVDCSKFCLQELLSKAVLPGFSATQVAENFHIMQWQYYFGRLEHRNLICLGRLCLKSWCDHQPRLWCKLYTDTTHYPLQQPRPYRRTLCEIQQL